jgi:hypothetical protein
MSKTVTINVDEEVEARFRKLAHSKYGNRKGSLGKAFTDALNYFISKKGEDPDANLLKLSKMGFKLGGIKVVDRSAWHER